MARHTRDLALVMDSICEAHPGDPNSLPAPEESYCSHLAEYEKHLPATMAWSPTLGGTVPVEEEVVQICKKAFTWFSSLGIDLVEVNIHWHVDRTRTHTLSLFLCAESF